MRRPLLLFALAAITACRSYHMHVPPPPPPPPAPACDGVVWVGDREAWRAWGFSLTGVYDSKWGEVQLVQHGGRVTGSYSCCGGGTIDGQIVGSTLLFRWTEGERTGDGAWTLESPTRLTGSWGSRGSRSSGGNWDLARRVDDALSAHEPPAPSTLLLEP